MVATDRAANNKFTYLFCEWQHKTIGDFVSFMRSNFDLPSFSIHCQVDKKTVEDRFKKMNETEEINEDAAAELEESNKKAEKNKADVESTFAEFKGKVRIITLACDGSTETQVNNLKSHFSAKVIIVNHEKKLEVDTTLSNLAIKYNMVYLSVYQLIRAHIGNNTAIGKALVASRKKKNLTASSMVADDQFEEGEFSAVHYDMELVIKLIQATITEKRTTQQFILLEGLCNNRKLQDENDKLSLRYMDELFQIEKHIGEVSAVSSLQFVMEPTTFTD